MPIKPKVKELQLGEDGLHGGGGEHDRPQVQRLQLCGLAVLGGCRQQQMVAAVLALWLCCSALLPVLLGLGLGLPAQLDLGLGPGLAAACSLPRQQLVGQVGDVAAWL
jgi:hypothetical protein